MPASGNRRVVSCRTREARAVQLPTLSRNLPAASNDDPLDLIEAELVAPAIIELRSARRGVVRHRGGLLERAAVLEIGRDARRPETVVAELGDDASRRRAPADHRIGVRL